MNELLLEPLKYYEKVGAAEHEKNLAEYVDSLVDKSGVDIAQNRATAKKYRAEKAAIAKLEKSRSGKKTLRGFLIFFMIVGIALAIYGIYALTADSASTGGICLGIGAPLIVLCIVLIKVVINPAIKALEKLLAEREKVAKELLDEAEKQVAPLNALFKDDDTLRLIEKTMPEFVFENRFSAERQEQFVKHYDLEVDQGKNCSVLDTLSGSFIENPFVYCAQKVHYMSSHTYHGTLVITWTETYRDSNGKTQRRTRTQTLHASVTRPKPEYYTRKQLFYGCQAAADLSFSREPKHSERLSEAEREHKVQKGTKKLKKKEAKALQGKGNFQGMANTEFDVLFGASDRNHEVQFRLMYTPLAQCNTVDLLTSTAGYGDDFHFTKRRRCNMIMSEHAQRWAMRPSASYYYSYDVDEIRKNFMQFNQDYFKSVFFDFAPCIAVPAYMEKTSIAMEGEREYAGLYSAYEHEVMANQMGAATFAHTATQTETILKTRFVERSGNDDVVQVTAYSFDTTPRVDFIPVFGGDGRMHSVPVHWTEYIPLERVSNVKMTSARRLQESETNMEDMAKRFLYHGMAAWVLG